MTLPFRRLLVGAAALATAVVSLPLVTSTAGTASASTTYQATITRTANGIPHIASTDYGGLGFGYGYAFTEDNLCTAADFYVTVNGQRSKFFGPNGTWAFRGNGTSARNLDSDFFYTRINDSGIIESLMDGSDAGPALTDDMRALVRGYVAGYNEFLADYRTDAADGELTEFAPHPCGDEPWVRPISEMDAFRRFFQLASLASAGIAINETGSAQPPTPSLTPPAVDDAALSKAIVEGLPDNMSAALGIGSNAFGIGSDLTDNGKGLVLGNPHFPWHDGERLYQSHLTVRTESGETLMDVSGASLYGVPLILIGHTDGLAWSHTVSTAYRFTPIELTLVPGSPTTYLVDGQPHQMTAREVTVELPGGDHATRTLYDTEYGPMFTGILGLPIFPWTPVKAFAMGDANVHLRYLNHFWAVNHAQSTDELYDIQRRYVGIPWVNTMAADRAGQAYYGDISSVPNVTDEKAQVCNTVVGAATFAALGLPVLDGARSSCRWGNDPDAPAPGIFGPSHLPHLFRDDYVLNSNDSYWLTNPEAPITGYARIIGNEGTARSLRTRNGLNMISEVEDRVAGGGIGMDRQEMADLVFNNRHYGGELVQADAVAMCRQMNGVYPNSVTGVELDPTGAACDALEGWGATDDLDDPGAVLFRRFFTAANGAGGGPFVVPFDINDPVNTPNTLNTAHPQVREALGKAVAELRRAGIPLDAPLRGYQYEVRGRNGQQSDPAKGGADKIAIHGGPGGLGVFNAISATWNSSAGYTDVAHGSSFVMVAHFVDPDANSGCGIDASAIVTYSQSENPASPWFEDQTRMYSDKIWNDMDFCPAEIAAHAISTRVVSATI